MGDRITDLGILDHLDAGSNEADLSRRQRVDSHRVWRKHTDLEDLIFRATGHEANPVPFFQGTIHHTNKNDNTLI